MNRFKNNSGFTVIELLIATTVFSILLLLALAGFLQIGQLFYKGVNITRTSDAGKQVVSSIKADISFDNSNATIARQSSSPVTDGTGTTYQRFYFCTGSNRYAGILGSEVNSDDAARELNGDFGASNAGAWYRSGLIKERISGISCTDPFNTSGTPIVKENATILLGDNMRLSDLTINPVLNTLYTLNVRIAYGIDEVLDDPLTTAIDPSSTNAQCKSGSNNTRYCFVSQFRTTVRKGLAP